MQPLAICFSDLAGLPVVSNRAPQVSAHARTPYDGPSPSRSHIPSRDNPPATLSPPLFGSLAACCTLQTRAPPEALRLPMWICSMAKASLSSHRAQQAEFVQHMAVRGQRRREASVNLCLVQLANVVQFSVRLHGSISVLSLSASRSSFVPFSLLPGRRFPPNPETTRARHIHRRTTVRVQSPRLWLAVPPTQPRVTPCMFLPSWW